MYLHVVDILSEFLNNASRMNLNFDFTTIEIFQLYCPLVSSRKNGEGSHGLTRVVFTWDNSVGGMVRNGTRLWEIWIKMFHQYKI